MSASSDGCRRERRCSLTDSRICVGLRSWSGATLSHAISERGMRSIKPGTSLRRAEPAQQAADADVGGDDAQCAAGARHLDVVDAHDLAAVDVDDLLVEEVLDQIQRFVIRRAHDLRRCGQHDAARVERGDFGDRRSELAVARLHDDRVDPRERVLGVLDDEVRDLSHGLARAVALHHRGAADQLGDEAFMECRSRHRCHPLSAKKKPVRGSFPVRPLGAMASDRACARTSRPQRRASAPHAIETGANLPLQPH